MHVCSVTSVVSDSFATPWTAAHQAPLFTGLSRQEYWNGLSFPSPGDHPNPGIKPGSPALHVDSLPSEPPRKAKVNVFKRSTGPKILLPLDLRYAERCWASNHTLPQLPAPAPHKTKEKMFSNFLVPVLSEMTSTFRFSFFYFPNHTHNE